MFTTDRYTTEEKQEYNSEMKGIKIMGLDSYIFNTTKNKEREKILEVYNSINKARSNGIAVGDALMFFSIVGETGTAYKLPSQVYWRKFNHVTAWLLQNALNNDLENLKRTIGVVTANKFKRLLKDCNKVLKHCSKQKGVFEIDEEYCKQYFPSFNYAFTGSQDYDENFIEELKTTVKDVKELLRKYDNPNASFIFCADF